MINKEIKIAINKIPYLDLEDVNYRIVVTFGYDDKLPSQIVNVFLDNEYYDFTFGIAEDYKGMVKECKAMTIYLKKHFQNVTVMIEDEFDFSE